MINLDGLQPFAQGGNRRCFVHPNNSYRCLKVNLKVEGEVIAKMECEFEKPKKLEGLIKD